MSGDNAETLEAELQQEEQELQQAKQIKKQKRKSFMPTNLTRCVSCDGVVYETEKVTIDRLILHKACFRCTECNGKLSIKNYASVNNKLYCKTHYLELFASSGGSYEVFGDAGFAKKTGRSSKVGVVEGGNATVKEEKPEKAAETVAFKANLKPVESKPVKEVKKSADPPAKPAEATTSSTTNVSTLTQAIKDKFSELNSSPMTNQREFFQKRYIFSLQLEGAKTLVNLASDFSAACKEGGDEESMTKGFGLSAFINDTEKKYDKSFTSKKQRDTIFGELDINGDGRLTFIEYALFHYKPMILGEYFKRMGQTAPAKLESVIGNVGNRKVVDILVEELFEVPAGVDDDLDKATAAFVTAKQERNEKILELRTQIANVGKVKGIGLQKELVNLEKQAEQEKEDVHVNAGIKRVTKKQLKLNMQISKGL